MREHAKLLQKNPLLPFAPEEKPESDGHIWLYNKVPIALPSSSKFEVLLKFGERDTPIEQFVKGLSDEPEPKSVEIRVELLGFYTNAIEIA